jgi:hypothetical protein
VRCSTSSRKRRISARTQHGGGRAEHLRNQERSFPNVNVRLEEATALEPDVVIARRTDLGGARLVGPPLLVAEFVPRAHP